MSVSVQISCCFVPVTLYITVKSPAGFVFCLAPALATQELLCFHTRFVTVFPSSAKNNVVRILMQIASKLQIPFGHMTIFTDSVNSCVV